MIKAILFDLDGTLADTLADLAAATNYALARRGHPPRAVEEFKMMVGNGSKLLMQRALPAGRQTPEEAALMLPDFLAHYGEHYAYNHVIGFKFPKLLCKHFRRRLRD